MDTPPPFDSLDEDRLAVFVEVMVLAASADGEFDEGERATLASTFESLTSRALAPALIDQVADRVALDVAERGRASCLAGLGAKLPAAAARKIAFDLALRITLADGVLRTSERDLLLEVADALAIDPDLAADEVKKASAGLA